MSISENGRSFPKVTREMMDGYGGQLPSAVYGCYSVIYLLEHEDKVMCAECASKQWHENAFSPEYTDDIVYSCYDEGPTIYCEDCGREIESQYGDPDETQEEE